MRIAIIGAGNGGQASAAFLGRAGHSIRLFDRFPEILERLPAPRQVRSVGAVEAIVDLEVASNDMGEVLEGADLVLVTLPGFALPWIASAMAPHLNGGEIVVLHPGGVGGALEVRTTWDRLGVPDDIVLSETDTLLFACRLRDSGVVDIKAVKRRLLVAALPAKGSAATMSRLADVVPQAVPATSVLETSLGTLNPIIHPTITLVNAGIIERRDHPFDFYGEGVTAGAARLLARVDGERLAIARSLGVPAVALLDWAPVAYDVSASDLETLYRELAANVYQGIGTPPALDARYVTEDVPLGLVPMQVLGTIAGVPTPTIDAVITIMAAMTGMDVIADGRTASRMGIEGFSCEDLSRRVGGEPSTRDQPVGANDPVANA